ncbi:type II toxin-antitoxin system RelE/ParE family toxin [Flavobacterium gawalongense]|uniref:Type II toxin-antitoxin system RelE/ParE family toxin n=1 Tax=Flavobacterium gawalongense TaxID=2594432 RepID=A0A553BTS9_9FLAO|nr:type II toxin-antitoxin system RelE/ParE family toxin [Flavobacterium gawalongense]TRX02246.1 type II toxin-antitoxin system RelE/ParE family toxin [Flavobacterium gawalongense]TRX07475.1 type II toxin-antitoxin system RelE/ParE family toxin [Flavobacterium gawalongense]TRX11648.1 type II toxin-antitoxin system RelE/ParE family toxin [Flavobacterium gawalongense]TRX12349.1 type II toxin-antitoxin system RelE/ParE family toxin [Flavobacterium gawalongense]TRX30386.1 type II toxin-antitoxin s
MKPVIWSNESIKSIQDIYDFIFFDSPQNAELVINTLFEIGENLNIFPEKNPIEPLFNSKMIRFFPKWNYKIVYRIEVERIYILDIFSTRRNPKKFII